MESNGLEPSRLDLLDLSGKPTLVKMKRIKKGNFSSLNEKGTAALRKKIRR